jgi:hypothetical protein
VNNPIITNHNLRLCGMTNWELGSAVEWGCSTSRKVAGSIPDEAIEFFPHCT